MGFEDQMSEHDEQWEEDKASRPGQLPDGDYQNAIITESRIEHNDSDDTYTWIQKWTAEFKEGTAGGEEVVRKGSVRKWYNLDHEVGRAIAAQDAAALGYEGQLSGLKKACEDEYFIGWVCTIKVVTKSGNERDFTNVYLNRVHGKGDASAMMPAAAGVGGDDDIPF